MITYRDATPADAPALAAMARTIFTQTFAEHYDPAAFATYCDNAFGPVLARHLADPAVAYRLAIEGDEIVGYAKATPLWVPAEGAQPGAVELGQLYVRQDRHGAGIAQALMDWTLERARTMGAPEIFLAVFDFNHRAKAFYARYGFVEVGGFDFTIGDRTEYDRIWRLQL